MSGRMAVHAGNAAHARRRHPMHARTTLRSRADLPARLAMLARRSADPGDATTATAYAATGSAAVTESRYIAIGIEMCS